MRRVSFPAILGRSFRVRRRSPVRCVFRQVTGTRGQRGWRYGHGFSTREFGSIIRWPRQQHTRDLRGYLGCRVSVRNLGPILRESRQHQTAVTWLKTLARRPLHQTRKSTGPSIGEVLDLTQSQSKSGRGVFLTEDGFRNILFFLLPLQVLVCQLPVFFLHLTLCLYRLHMENMDLFLLPHFLLL